MGSDKLVGRAWPGLVDCSDWVFVVWQICNTACLRGFDKRKEVILWFNHVHWGKPALVRFLTGRFRPWRLRTQSDQFGGIKTIQALWWIVGDRTCLCHFVLEWYIVTLFPWLVASSSPTRLWVIIKQYFLFCNCSLFFCNRHDGTIWTTFRSHSHVPHSLLHQ